MRALHIIFILFSIFVPKIMKVAGNLTKF